MTKKEIRDKYQEETRKTTRELTDCDKGVRYTSEYVEWLERWVKES